MSLSTVVKGKFRIVNRARNENWFSNYEWFKYCEYLN